MNKDKGVSLVELIISMLILSIVMTYVFLFIQQSAQQVSMPERTLQALNMSDYYSSLIFNFERSRDCMEIEPHDQIAEFFCQKEDGARHARVLPYLKWPTLSRAVMDIHVTPDPLLSVYNVKLSVLDGEELLFTTQFYKAR